MGLPFSSKIDGSLKYKKSIKYFILDSKTYSKDSIHVETVGVINKKKFVMGFIENNHEFVIKEITPEKKDKKFEAQIKKLKKLKILKDSGIINDDEYRVKKQVLLKKIKF